MNSQTKILSTKKLSSEQKKLLQDADFDVIDENFIEVKFNDFDLKSTQNNLIITSKNALKSISQHKDFENLKSKTVFCVGIKTKELLEESGFNVEVYVDYAEDLAEIISLIYKEEKFTFFCGNLRRNILPKGLKKAKIDCSEIEVYETKLSPVKMKEKVDAILFFSPSGVESYLKVNKINKEICFCIGNTTAEALENSTKNIIVAEYPSIENVIEECINEFV